MTKEQRKQKRKFYSQKRNSEKAKKNGGIKCPWCNYYYISLGSHAFAGHNITAFNFRKENNWNKNHRLTADEYHQNRVEAGKEIIKKRLERDPNWIQKGQERLSVLRKTHSAVFRERRQEFRDNKKKQYLIKKCVICGNEFRTSPHIVKNGRGTTCSCSCAGKYRTLLHKLNPR